MKKLETLADVGEVLHAVDWSHAYIQHAALVSRSCVLPDRSVTHPDSLPDLWVHVVSQASPPQAAALLRFVNVEEIHVAFSQGDEFKPDVRALTHDTVEFHFHDDCNGIKCQEMWYELDVPTDDCWLPVLMSRQRAGQ